MTNQPEPQPQAKELSKLILESLRLPVKIAQQTIKTILFLLIANLGSTLWLTFFVSHTFKTNLSANGLMAFVIMLPSFTLGKLYFTLQEIIGLPEQVTQFFATTKSKILQLNQAQEKIRAKLKDPKFQLSEVVAGEKNFRYWLALGKRLRDWFFLAKRLREVRSIMSEFEGLAALTSGVVVLANPLFMIGVTISVVATLFWGLVALITLVIHVF